MSGFKRATKKESKLRMALAGPSGSGKTYTALSVALALCPGSVALLDTERRSASKYADVFAFDVLDIDPPYHPDRFIAAIKDAAAAGYQCLVIDSLSHAWNGEGGLLEVVDALKKRAQSRNAMDAWRDATPLQQRLIDALTRAPMHIIATMRSKQIYEMEKDDKGKLQVRKLGLAPVQRDDVEYEFDLYAMMDSESTIAVQKTRCSALSGYVRSKPTGEDLATPLRAWLEGEQITARAVDYGTAGDGTERITEEQHARCVALLADERLSAAYAKKLDERLMQAIDGKITRRDLNRAILGCKEACAGSAKAYDDEQKRHRTIADDGSYCGEPSPNAEDEHSRSTIA